MPTRAIAPVLRVTQQQVQRDTRANVTHRVAPESTPSPARTFTDEPGRLKQFTGNDESYAMPAPSTVTGMDGLRLKHPEWVLMYRAGITPPRIAEFNRVPPRRVREYLGRIRRVHPGLLAGRLMLHDRPRQDPKPRTDRDVRWKASLHRYQIFTAEHGRRPAVGDPVEFSLAHWLTTQRSQHRQGRLTERRARWLDQAIPDWQIDTRTLTAESSRRR